jgi:hypothetical protein
MDPGTVAFSHHRHLTLTETDRPEAKEAVRRMQKMQCAYCHEPDDGGRYMKPIRYENHCRDCHPLQAKVASKLPAGPITDAAAAFAARPVPHPAPGQKPDAVRAALRERFLDFARAHSQVWKPGGKAEEAPFPLPGRRERPPLEGDLAWANEQMQQAERALFDGPGGCRHCHQEKPGARINGLPDLGIPTIPPRWLKDSVFSHERHRMMACTDCHPGAAASTKADDVLMPRVADCKTCHNPAAGARSDCAECHTYHHRPAAAAGASPARAGRP